MRAAVSRVQLHEPLEDEVINANSNVLVLGAGPAGLKAAVTAAQAGRDVVLVEKSSHIGGLPGLYEEVFPAMECGPCMLEPLEDELLHGAASTHIEILTESELEGVEGFYGNLSAHVWEARGLALPTELH